MQHFILAAHALSTLCMTGLIWFVQIVHYPMFAFVGSEAFVNYEDIHKRLTTYVVMPLMLVELATAILLVASPPAQLSKASLWTGLALVGIAWISTAALQVPAHNVLSKGFDTAVHQKLVSTNWIRTVAWSARGLLVVWWYAVLIGPTK